MSPLKSVVSKRKGKAPAEPSFPPNPHGILFRDELQATKYHHLVERKIVATKYADKRTLETLGLYEDVMWMFKEVGALQFFQMTPHTYLPLVLEFLSSLDIKFEGCPTKSARGEITFRMSNIERKLSVEDLRSIFQFDSEGYASISPEYDEDEFWSRITQENHFSASTARASKMSNPCLKYVQRVLAHTVFGRGESDGMVRQTELFFLWSMLSRYPLDVVFFLLKHIEKVSRAQKGTIVIGGFVTPIALHLKIEPYGVEVVRGNPRIDLESCIAMRMIRREGDGYSLILEKNQTLPLPCVEKTTVRNQAHWRLHAEYEEGTTPLPPGDSSGDHYEAKMEQPSGAAGSSARHAHDPRFPSILDPGLRYLSTQLSRQELKLERVMHTVGDIKDSVGDMKNSMHHMHKDIEGLNTYMKEMGNFLHEYFNFRNPNESRGQGNHRGTNPNDPMDLTQSDEADE